MMRKRKTLEVNLSTKAVQEIMAIMTGDSLAEQLIGLTIVLRQTAEESFKTKEGKDYSLTIYNSDDTEFSHHIFFEWTCGTPYNCFTTVEYCWNTFSDMGLSPDDIMAATIYFAN